MSISGFVGLSIAVLAIVASVRTIRRVGLRRFSLAVGRLGWDVSKIAVSGTVLVGGALVAAAHRNTDEDSSHFGSRHNPCDSMDPANYVRADSPHFINKDEGEV